MTIPDLLIESAVPGGVGLYEYLLVVVTPILEWKWTALLALLLI